MPDLVKIAVKIFVFAIAFYAVLYASISLFDLMFGTFELGLLAGAFFLGCVGIVLREVRLARTTGTGRSAEQDRGQVTGQSDA